MPGMVIEIGANIKPAVSGINEVSISLRQMQKVVVELKAQYAALSTTQALSPIGHKLKDDISVAEQEVKRLSGTTKNALGEMYEAAHETGRGFSALRRTFFELGEIGLLLGLTDFVTQLFDTSDAFDKIDIAAGHFDNTMRQLKDDVENFKNILDFEGKIEKISLELSGLTGTKLQGAQTGVDISKSVDQVFELTGAIKKLTDQNDNLVKTRTEFEKTVNSFGKTTELAKLIIQFGQLSDLPEAAVKKLSKADQELVREYQKRTDEIKALSKQRDAAFQGGLLSGAGLAIPTIREENKATAKEKIKREIPKLGSFDLELTPVLSKKAFPLSAIKTEIKRIQDEIGEQSKFGDLSKPGKAFQNLQEDGLSAMDKMIKRQQENFKNLGDIISGITTPAIDGMFAAIKQGGNAFQAFAQAAGQALIGLITKLIETAALAAILSAITGGAGGVGIGKGIAGFKSIFSSLLGFRAAGGPVSAGRPYIVGEHRAELFVPSTSGRIVPNLRGITGAAHTESDERLITRMHGMELDIILQRFYKYKGTNA